MLVEKSKIEGKKGLTKFLKFSIRCGDAVVGVDVPSHLYRMAKKAGMLS